MPELPEVETIRRDLLERLKGAELREISIRSLDYILKRGLAKSEFKNLARSKLSDILRRGKQIGFVLDQKALVFHLGLTGSLIFKEVSNSAQLHIEDHKHLILLLKFDRGILFFNDPRKFGNLRIIPAESLENYWNSSLGPDALYVTKDTFEAILKKGRGIIKKFLLDQKNISGLGNIYVDELLFRVKIHPERKVESLSLEEIEKLFTAMKELLEEAILLRGSSIRDYVDGTGSPGHFQTKHLVYGKRGKPCPRCSTPLKYINIQGRGTTFCPECQK